MSRRLLISVTAAEGTPPSDAIGSARETASRQGTVLHLHYTGKLDAIETSDGDIIKSGNGMTIHTFEAEVEPAETHA